MALDLEAIELIKQLKSRYFRGIDTANMEALAQCMAPDVSAHFFGGSYEIKVEGFDEVMGFLKQSFHADAAASHFGHTPEITVDGDTATGLWYLYDIFYDLAREVKTSGSAVYEDTYIKTQDGWKIKTTGYKRIWERVEPFKDDGRFTARRLGETGFKVEGLEPFPLPE